MTTPSDTSDSAVDLAADDTDRRLHPMSWLFIVLQQLKAFALPLVILLITGRGSQSELAGLVGVGGLAVAAMARYLTFRYRLGPDGVVLTSGVFQRTRRDIPYERIHDVLLHRSIVHRLFNVAEVRLESAGGARSEGEMRVLSLADAQAIESIVRRRGASESVRASGGVADEPAAVPLLTLDTREVVRLGLISNRGLVVVAALFGALMQALPDAWSRPEAWTGAWRFMGDHPPPSWMFGPVGAAIAVAAVAVAAIVVLRVLSVTLALLQFHGFTLTAVGPQLRLERGLLTRLRHHVPTRRIQAWKIEESLLHRWFGRRSLQVDSAVNPGENAPGTRDLIPLAPAHRLDELVGVFLPRHTWPPDGWRRFHPRAWRRLIVRPAILVAAVTAIAVWRLGAAGFGVLVLLPGVAVRARLWAANAAYVETHDGLIAVREGWLRRSWRFAEVRKLQTVRLTESPFDRRHGMATVWLDTAGARAGALRVPFLPANEARALYDRLSSGLDRRNG